MKAAKQKQVEKSIKMEDSPSAEEEDSELFRVNGKYKHNSRFWINRNWNTVYSK